MAINTKNNLNVAQQRGFSLIELMVAIPLGLLVMFAVLQIFTASVQGVRLQNAYSRVQENGRVSLALLSRDIRAADFWGCVHDTSLISDNLDSTDADYDATLIPSGQQGVSGENNVTSKVISTISVRDDTDTLTLRGSKGFSQIKIETPYMTNTSSVIHITTNSGIVKGDVILISDCQGGDLFSNTVGDTDNNGTLVHNSGNLGTGHVDNATTPFSHTYEGSAQIFIPYVKTYFIGENSAGGYSLFRSDDGIAKELVRGVNNLQFVYGEDTNGNGSADTFSDSSAVTNMDWVRSIRVQLVSESGRGGSGTSLEKNYAVSANIRNRSLQ